MKWKRVLGSDYLLLALLTLPACLSLLLNAGLPNTADGVLHLYRTVELDRAWHDGVFYPRIAPDFAYGYGYPIFNYYAPLFYWLSQLFHVVGLNFELAVKAAILLIFYLYPLGMYLFARALLQRSAALVAAAAYLYVPYRFYEAYIQGDYPQFLALAIVPFCLWAVTPCEASPQPAASSFIAARCGGDSPIMSEGQRGGDFHFLTFIIAYAALVLSHNITALIATPLIGAYMLFILASRLRQSAARVSRLALRFALAISLSVALSAFFWLPALGEQKYVHIEKLTRGFFNFRNYFLTPSELLSSSIPPDLAGVNPYIPFNLGPAIVIVAAGGIVLGIVARLRRQAHQLPLQLFFAAAALALSAMSLPISTPLWEHVPLLVLTEFPWRFVGLAAIPLAVLAGFASAELQFAPSSLFATRPTGTASCHSQIAAAILCALIALDSFVYLFPRTPFLQYGNPSLSDIAKFERDSQALGTTSAGEYLPLWTQRRMYDSPLMSQLLSDRVPDHLQREALPVTVQVQPIAQTVVREAYRFKSVGPLAVHLQRIYFPGWRATIDGQPVPLELIAPTGTMRVLMPAGEHVVDFTFGETVLRQIADGVSALALLICAGIWVYERKRVNADERRTTHGDFIAAPSFATAIALIIFYFVAPHIGFVRFSALPQIIGVQHARNDEFGGEMRLLAYDLSAAAVSAGDALRLTLYWQPLRTIQKDYAVFVHLDNPLTLETVAQTLNDHPGNISTVELPLSLYVRDSHVLTVSAAVEPGLYLLRVGMINTRTDEALSVVQPDGSHRTRLSLQTVRVRRAAPPDLSGMTRAQVRFGPIELLGYTLDQTDQLTLYWRTGQPCAATRSVAGTAAPCSTGQTPNADATIFVHLLDAANQAVATFDGPPAGGLLPISAWEKDEIVVDRRSIKPNVSGTFRIAMGLYDPQSLQRYPAMADGQRLAEDQFVIVR